MIGTHYDTIAKVQLLKEKIMRIFPPIRGSLVFPFEHVRQ
jgi:hypothetical protein